MPKAVKSVKQVKHKANGQVKQALKKLTPSKRAQRAASPLWEGPTDSGPLGGVTQSLLSSWFCCKERCRLTVIEGIKEEDHFNHRIEYGNFWHLAEEALGNNKSWQDALTAYAKELVVRYRNEQQQILHWYNVAMTQFPIYVEHWSKYPDALGKSMFREQVFKISYSLPSGRIVQLRGKWDGVDLVDDKLVIQENKIKGEFYEDQLKNQLLFDLQTMVYSIVLKRLDPKLKFAGVRYNVVRRPLSGGKYSIVQRKGRGAAKAGAESDTEFYSRLAETIRTSEPEVDGSHYFFKRWFVTITDQDMERFAVLCLDPVLENLCDDYEWWRFCKLETYSPFELDVRSRVFPLHKSRHYVTPFGIWNPTVEGRVHPLDKYLLSKDMQGLHVVNSLFPELQTNG